MIATISVLQLNGSMNESYTRHDEHTRFLAKLKLSGCSKFCGRLSIELTTCKFSLQLN